MLPPASCSPFSQSSASSALRYGLIGRNGTGKSTLLRALASRRVSAFPDQLAVHYVSQDVKLTGNQAGQVRRGKNQRAAAHVSASIVKDSHGQSNRALAGSCTISSRWACNASLL